MTDVLERMAAANPAAEDRSPSIDDVWRKLAAAPDRRITPPRWRPAMIALVAVPVLIVLVAIVMPLTGAHRGARAGHATAPASGSRQRLDPAAQALARRALAGRIGTVVVLDPRTGAIRALYATPQAARVVPSQAPFDIVAATAALDTRRFGVRSRVSGASPAGGVRNPDGAQYGAITLAQAMTYSVDTAFARVGTRLGTATLIRYLERFGVGADALAGAPAQLAVTPLQLARIAAVIARGGGGVTTRAGARAVTAMLVTDVARGTGTMAGRASVTVAGKTGTEPLGRRTMADSFVAFAPASDAKVVVAVVVQGRPGTYGGTLAAPIAAEIIRGLLARGG